MRAVLASGTLCRVGVYRHGDAHLEIATSDEPGASHDVYHATRDVGIEVGRHLGEPVRVEIVIDDPEVLNALHRAVDLYRDPDEALRARMRAHIGRRPDARPVYLQSDPDRASPTGEGAS